MGLRPDSSDDGPVTVRLDNGKKLTFDRIQYVDSAVKLYDVEKTYMEHGGVRYNKGNRARAIPMHRILNIEYDEYGGDA